MGFGKWIAGALGWAMFRPLGEDVQKAAEEKFKAVSQAYEAICRERGIGGVR